jgi:hypothetical protein
MERVLADQIVAGREQLLTLLAARVVGRLAHAANLPSSRRSSERSSRSTR